MLHDHARQHELYRQLLKKDERPVVIDSGEILKDPERALTKLCFETGIPFEKKMLKWKAGPLKEDGVWAKYWYANVHKSTGFEKQDTSSRKLPDELLPLYKEAVKFYDEMYKFSIKV